jgi:predicted RNase H-like HicB family nuclease
MRYSVLLEPVGELENMPGCFYAHVPSLGITTHGQGMEGALEAARDLIQVWLDETGAVSGS